MVSSSSNNSKSRGRYILGVIVTIITSGTAGIVVTHYFESSDREQLEWQHKIDILRPARNMLVSNQADYDTLMNRYPGLEHLEYYVDYVRQHFDSRPEYGESWRFYIGRIWNGNERVIHQVQWYIDSCVVLTPELQQLSIDFIRQATLWNSMWERVALSVSGQPLPAIDSETEALLNSIRGDPIGEMFPAEFPIAVEREYNQLKIRAGLE